ncbi:MAG: AmmeMemoRadiSam system protein B [Ignavibacteriales bacterium]|nr:AmmeMemoRadiSam system protein B [Ignavibacteriales bacterium]
MIRQPAVAGMFYAGDANQLTSDIEETFQGLEGRRIGGPLIALVVPHAGYMYSGRTAAYAYRLLVERSFDTIVLVGPSHQDYFGGVSVYPGEAYRTPLGDVPLDTALRDSLVECSPLIRSIQEGHRQEHSLEVQIPFLQIVSPKSSILPLVMGDQREETCLELGRALSRCVAGKKILLVASSDLSHFYPSHLAKRKDTETMSAIAAMDEEELLAKLDNGRVEACGGGPIAAVIGASKLLGAAGCTILHSCNSGDITGDRNRVVGYCSAAIWRAN